MNKSIYVGNGRKIDGQYGLFRSVSICIEDLPEEFKKKAKNGKTYIGLLINDKDEEDQYGNDVSVTVNQYKKED